MVAHGFADDYFSPWWRPVRTHFEDWGYDVLEIDFDGLGRTVRSPETYAREVQTVIDDEYDAIATEFEPEEIVVVAHSMGGLTSRYCIEQMGYDDEVDVLITFGSPHQGSWLAKPFGMVGIEGARDISPGSDFLERLNADGVSENVDYLNVYSANDPVFLAKERARLPDAENVTNVELGEPPGKVLAEKVTDTTDVWSNIFDDYRRDLEDAFELGQTAMFQPWKLLNPDNQFRVTDPRMVGLRLGQLFHAAKVETDDVPLGHLTMFYNERTWKTVHEYLEAHPTIDSLRKSEA